MVVSSISTLRFGPGHPCQDDQRTGTTICGRSLEWISCGSSSFKYSALRGRIGPTIDGSSFPGSLTLVEIGHIRIGSAGNGRIRSCGVGHRSADGQVGWREDERHAVMNIGHQLVSVCGDGRERADE